MSEKSVEERVFRHVVESEESVRADELWAEFGELSARKSIRSLEEKNIVEITATGRVRLKCV